MAKDQDRSDLIDAFMLTIEDLSDRLSDVGMSLVEEEDFATAQGLVGAIIAELTDLRTEIQAEVEGGNNVEE